MLEKVHDHIVGELQQNARTDTIFVITAVAFNFVALAISWSVAGNPYGRQRGQSPDWILGLLFVITLVINVLSIRALSAGKRTRLRLLKGLLEMYRDQGVDRYYDAAVLEDYSKRYSQFIGVVVVVGAMALLVPVLARLLG